MPKRLPIESQGYPSNAKTILNQTQGYQSKSSIFNATARRHTVLHKPYHKEKRMHPSITPQQQTIKRGIYPSIHAT